MASCLKLESNDKETDEEAQGYFFFFSFKGNLYRDKKSYFFETKLWYKYYSGGWCTWPTPLKYPESKSKSNEA